MIGLVARRLNECYGEGLAVRFRHGRLRDFELLPAGGNIFSLASVKIIQVVAAKVIMGDRVMRFLIGQDLWVSKSLCRTLFILLGVFDFLRFSFGLARACNVFSYLSFTFLAGKVFDLFHVACNKFIAPFT